MDQLTNDADKQSFASLLSVDLATALNLSSSQVSISSLSAGSVVASALVAVDIPSRYTAIGHGPAR